MPNKESRNDFEGGMTVILYCLFFGVLMVVVGNTSYSVGMKITAIIFLALGLTVGVLTAFGEDR